MRETSRFNHAPTKMKKLNVRLLRHIQKQILKEPKQFQMDSFFSNEEDWKIPNCGTAACIAGWAFAMTKKLNPAKAEMKDGDTPIGTRSWIAAIRELGITQDMANRLFLHENWPYQFQRKPSHNARQAVARIEFFIKTKGTDEIS